MIFVALSALILHPRMRLGAYKARNISDEYSESTSVAIVLLFIQEKPTVTYYFIMLVFAVSRRGKVATVGGQREETEH